MASVVEAAGLIDGWFGVSMTVDDVHGGFDAELIGEFATQFGFTNNFAGVCGIVADGGGMYGARDRGKGLLFSGWDCESVDYGAGGAASAYGDTGWCVTCLSETFLSSLFIHSASSVFDWLADANFNTL